MTKNSFRSDLGLFVLRVALGLYILLAGVGKIQGEFENGVGSFYRDKFKGMQPDWLPTFLGVPYGYALPWLEVIVGGLLILGLFGCVAATVGTLMLGSFTAAIVMKTGKISGIAEGEWGIFHLNYIQMAGYLLLALVGCGRWGIDTVINRKRKKKD